MRHLRGTGRNKGMTLIEILVALVISSFLIAGVYRAFFAQQKTYAVQEQVVDVQQNARVAISRMMDELRMAGFGSITPLLPVSIGGRNYTNVINRDVPDAGSLTFLSALGDSATLTAIPSGNQVTVARLVDGQGNPLFDTANRRYVSIGGLEGHVVSAVDPGTKTLTLTTPLRYTHLANKARVFPIRAITYRVNGASGTPVLERDENLGAGPQPVAEPLDALQFEYLDANGNATATPASIRAVRATITARSTLADPDQAGGDGYRRRQMASNIYLRNMGVLP